MPVISRRNALILPAATLAAPAYAQQNFPNRPIRMIVPYTPGGVSDITARLIAEPMAAALGQAVPVENRAGADGVIGTDVIAKAAPDGQTLGLVSVGHPVNAAFYRLPFDTVRDFTFLSMTTRTPLVMCAARSFAPNTPAEFVALAKSQPAGRLTFAGTAGLVRRALGDNDRIVAALYAEGFYGGTLKMTVAGIAPGSPDVFPAVDTARAAGPVPVVVKVETG
eukprot:gene48404-59281_t